MTTKTVFARIEKSIDKAFDATFVMSAADLDRTNDTIDPKAYDANISFMKQMGMLPADYQ